MGITLIKVQNEEIIKAKLEHVKICNTCFITFTRQGYYSASDHVFAGIFFNELLDASTNSDWVTVNGARMFHTSDCFGCNNINKEANSFGPCARFITGSFNLQGRILSKIYAGSQAALKVETFKPITGFRVDVDVRDVDPDKIRLFANAYIEYFKHRLLVNG